MIDIPLIGIPTARFWCLTHHAVTGAKTWWVIAIHKSVLTSFEECEHAFSNPEKIYPLRGEEKARETYVLLAPIPQHSKRKPFPGCQMPASGPTRSAFQPFQHLALTRLEVTPRNSLKNNTHKVGTRTMSLGHMKTLSLAFLHSFSAVSESASHNCSATLRQMLPGKTAGCRTSLARIWRSLQFVQKMMDSQLTLELPNSERILNNLFSGSALIKSSKNAIAFRQERQTWKRTGATNAGFIAKNGGDPLPVWST